MSAQEQLRDRLASAAQHVPIGKAAISDIKQKFAELLESRGLQPEQIQAALETVSLPTMHRVISGKEPLQIASLSNPFARLNFDQEVVILPESVHHFPAGPRAAIEVKGPMTREQRQQTTLIAQLLRSVLT